MFYFHPLDPDPMTENASRGWGVSAGGAQELHGGSMAGKERSSPEMVEKALGSSVFDGKGIGSKRGPSQTHLGCYRSSGDLGGGTRRKTADGSSCAGSAPM